MKINVYIYSLVTKMSIVRCVLKICVGNLDESLGDVSLINVEIFKIRRKLTRLRMVVRSMKNAKIKMHLFE